MWERQRQRSSQVGELVAVDEDYVAQTGFVGSGVSAAYVSSPASVANDINYVRRVTLNVGRVVGIANGVLAVGCGAAGGITTFRGMQVSPLVGFVDREGGWILSRSGRGCL